MTAPVRINGEIPDWGRASIDINGEIFTALKEVSYEDNAEDREDVGGTHPVPDGRTRGTYKAEGSLMFSDIREHRRFLDLLGNGFGEVLFPITVQYSMPGEEPITDKLFNCQVKGTKGGGSRGAALESEVPIDIGLISWNGKTLFSDD